ncbi:outer membrane protein assembly factor BamD [Pseudofulvimonas gallinarii]|nr:outer membrane protein assembly factor BamD [Pseudofulvimonas gallinarii]
MRMMRCLRLLSLLSLLLLVAACGGKRLDKTETLPVDQLYEIARESLSNGNNDRAIRYYQRLIARFPFGLYTEQAQLDLAFALYKGKKPDQAISAVDRFLKTYPTHSKADYAQYLRGIVNFYREMSFLGRFVELDPAHRDLNAPRQAFTDFSKLLRDYPDSAYAADARQRMVYLRNTLARHEVQVAAYYLRRHAYVAALNRSKYVLENYQQAPETGDALALMVEAYERLGEQELADDTRRVLQLNHPDHAFLTEDRSVVRRKPFWRRLVPFG